MRDLRRFGVPLAVLCASAMLATSLASTAGARHGASPPENTAKTSLFGLQYVRIGGTSYFAGDIAKIAGYVSRTSAVKYVLNVASQCKAARAFFFASTAGGGAVAWLPTNLTACLGVVGGGPGAAPAFSPCAQAFNTPVDQDPRRLVSGRGIVGTRFYVVIAGTSERVCRDLSTQVPGGIWTRARVSFPGLSAGSAALIKCQGPTSGGLADELATYSATLPSPKAPWWVYDRSVVSGYRWRGVPACGGGNF
jgi:hypothetical protein